MKKGLQLHDYQKEKVKLAEQILRAHGVVYLAGHVRTGKTLVSLHTAARYFAPSSNFFEKPQVLFATRKKAMKSIENDYMYSGLSKHFDLLVVSMDSLHKVAGKPDLVIMDEAHMMGSFPKPSKRAKIFRQMFAGVPTILLSGTPSPESYSQLYHQFWITGRGPWSKFPSFYIWARKYVAREKIYIGLARPLNDWSLIKNEEKFLREFNKYKVSMTQKEAGFKGKVIEKVIRVPAPQKVHDTIQQLRKEKIAHGRLMIAHTSAQLYQYYHQLCSGTYINSEGVRKIISRFKVNFIKEKYQGKKIAIFYLYQAEGHILRQAFYHTDVPEEFNDNDDLAFICQVTSGSMGVDLRTADVIIFFNISHSATQYWQARSRSQSRDGGDTLVHWLFSDTGIEDDIYEVVQGKKNYTVQHFEKFLKKKNSKQLKLF